MSPLLTTSDEAYSKLAGYGMETYQKEEGDEAGPFALAAAATETLAGGTESHVIWMPPRLCSMINTTSRSPARIRIFPQLYRVDL